MFDTLTEKLNAVFKKLAGKGRLSETDVDAALREVRLALLEADIKEILETRRVLETLWGLLLLLPFTLIADILGVVQEETDGADGNSIRSGQERQTKGCACADSALA